MRALARVALACLRDPRARRARMDAVVSLYGAGGWRSVARAVLTGRRSGQSIV